MRPINFSLDIKFRIEISKVVANLKLESATRRQVFSYLYEAKKRNKRRSTEVLTRLNANYQNLSLKQREMRLFKKLSRQKISQISRETIEQGFNQILNNYSEYYRTKEGNKLIHIYNDEREKMKKNQIHDFESAQTAIRESYQNWKIEKAKKDFEEIFQIMTEEL